MLWEVLLTLTFLGLVTGLFMTCLWFWFDVRGAWAARRKARNTMYYSNTPRGTYFSRTIEGCKEKTKGVRRTLVEALYIR
jgi:hypothetical protein